MRSWHPISPRALDNRGLLAEHGEVHIMLGVLAGEIRGWQKHPEVLRWARRRNALIRRHDLLAVELLRRGFHHGTPVHFSHRPTRPDAKGPVPLWQPLKTMRALLKQKVADRAVKDARRAFVRMSKLDKSKGVFE